MHSGKLYSFDFSFLGGLEFADGMLQNNLFLNPACSLSWFSSRVLSVLFYKCLVNIL